MQVLENYWRYVHIHLSFHRFLFVANDLFWYTFFSIFTLLNDVNTYPISKLNLMNYPVSPSSAGTKHYTLILRLSLGLILVSAIAFGGYKVVLNSTAAANASKTPETQTGTGETKETKALVIQDSIAYEAKHLHITNGDTTGKWPVKSEYPLTGAVLPFKRIVSFYGNLYSKQMGILGE